MNFRASTRPQLLAALVLAAALVFAGCASNKPTALPKDMASNNPFVVRKGNGVVVRVGQDFLYVEVRSASIIRVAYAKDEKFFDHQSLAVVPNSAKPVWSLVTHGDRAIVATEKMRAEIDVASGRVSFLDAAGKPIVAEKSGGRLLVGANVQGLQTYHVRQRWEDDPNEALFGLGQQQFGITNIKGYDLDLWQHNTNIVVPMLLSSRGFGIFWDNPSFTRFGDLRPTTQIPGEFLRDASRAAGGLTGSYFSGSKFDRLIATRVDPAIAFDTNIHAAPTSAPTSMPTSQPRVRSNVALHPDLPPGDASVRWQGDLVPNETGDYTFHAYSNGGIRFTLGDRVLMNHWRQSWLPSDDLARAHLLAGKHYPITLEWTKDGGANVFSFDWKTPTLDPSTSLWSEVGDGIDYYFVYGPDLDSVVAGYRNLTGQATMPPQWAMGLWQSRQRYEIQQASLNVIDGFRLRQIPFDNIVQDWMYWQRDKWGSHEFDSTRFPDPAGWTKAIHEKNAHVMISVWGKFYPGTANFDELNAHGFLYQPNLREGTLDFVGYPFTFYDAFNAGARAMFWRQIKTALFDKGVDAWWMDASEPDMQSVPTPAGAHERMNPTALGPAGAVLNAYALENARAIYEGQIAAAPDQRVFDLTRSGFAGQQRYAAASWSGDISSTWTAMRKQIAAGLGFSISGVPYWTMDIGGFSVPQRFARRENPLPADVDEWRELNTRWFEFGTFVPLLRVHGEFPFREMWQFGGDTSPAFAAMLRFDRLRYRLLPYIYSLAGNVTQNGGSIMRPLVMDFPDDPHVRSLADEYLFGPSILVSPVTTYQARSRRVVLPKTPGGWFDFWTGEHLAGGQTIDSAAPLSAIPLHVRGGSILPIGPELQYVAEKKPDPITLLIYAGADAKFDLYEDDGLTNAYQTGAFSRIALSWNDANRTLTIGQRSGAFNGMLNERTFQIVLIRAGRPVPFAFDLEPQQTVKYSGAETRIEMKR